MNTSWVWYSNNWSGVGAKIFPLEWEPSLVMALPRTLGMHHQFGSDTYQDTTYAP